MDTLFCPKSGAYPHTSNSGYKTSSMIVAHTTTNKMKHKMEYLDMM